LPGALGMAYLLCPSIRLVGGIVLLRNYWWRAAMGALAVAILGTAFLARDTSHAQTTGVQLQSGFTNVAYLGPTLPLL